MKLVILDYSSGSVYVFTIPFGWDVERIEEFITKEKDFSMNHIHYMTTNELEIIVD